MELCIILLLQPIHDADCNSTEIQRLHATVCILTGDAHVNTCTTRLSTISDQHPCMYHI